MINPEKKPATENPWDVLATLIIESDKIVVSEARRYWNAWASQEMTKEEKAAIKNRRGKSILSDDPEWEFVREEVERLFKQRLPKTKLPRPSEPVDFSDIEFSNDIRFTGFFFPKSINFNRATFGGEANFRNAIFSRQASFQETTFSGNANFMNAKFSGEAIFEKTTFSGDASFMNAKFSGKAYFMNATFSGEAYFKNAKFSGDANFKNAKFSGPSKFISTKFSKAANFSDAVFDAPCNFRDVEFKTAYPNLLGTQLHSKTNVTAENKYWPIALIEQSNNANKNVLESCAHLRQNMASQGLIEAAHFFFRREMDHKAKLSRWWERPFYEVYRWAEYGHGVWQPLVGIFLLWLSGALSLIYWGSLHWTTALGLSAANIFKFFGFQRVYFEDDVIGKLNPYLQSMTAAQTVIGYFLLFLLGLGLRNRFRLK